MNNQLGFDIKMDIKEKSEVKEDEHNLIFNLLKESKAEGERLHGIEIFANMIHFLKKNKISFLWLKKFDDSLEFKDFFASEYFYKAYMNELEIYKNWKRDFVKIKTAWDKARIDYIFIKSVGLFPHNSDNLDVLVSMQRFEDAGKILSDMDFINLRNIQEAHKKFFRKFIGGKSCIPIHLHERVCWVVPYENNEHLWKNYIVSEEDNIVHYPCSEDAILINIAHCFLEDHLIKILDLLTIKKCLDNEINWEYIIKTAEDMCWLHALYTGIVILNYLYANLFKDPLFPSEIIEKANNYVNKRIWIKKILKRHIFVDNPTFPFKIPHLWTRIHSSLRILNDKTLGKFLNRCKLTFEYLFVGVIHVVLGIRPHPKMFIAVNGLDGSGKSTHCKALKNSFITCEINPGYLWSRAGSLPITSTILKTVKYFRFWKKKSSAKPSKAQGFQFPRNRLFVSLWRIINIIDLILYYFVKIRIPKICGKVVIADRYIYDSIIDLEYVGKSSNFNRISYKLLKLLTPSPNILFFLDANPEIIVKRGSDETLDDLEKKYFCYKTMMLEHKAVYIDNSKSFDEVSEKISYITLSKFFAKYPDKYDGYNLISLRYK